MSKMYLLRRQACLCRSLLWLIVFSICISTTTMARGQTGDPRTVKVTLTVKDRKLSQVLDHIRQTYELQLIYPSNIDRLTRPVSFTLKSAGIDEAMKVMLKNTGLEYVLEGKVVMIREAMPPAKPVNSNTGTLNVPLVATVLNKDITGKVTDSKGLPLPGVSIQVRGSQRGTTTNVSGFFELKNVEENTVLVISMTGYRQQVITVGALTVLNIQLEESPSDLDQVIITGYMSQSKRSVTGSIVKVKGEEIENMPVQSFDKALQGRAAGVLVQSQTGVPGGAVRVNIRGIGSIGAGTEPMYIVDGVQINSDAPTTRTSTNALTYINPNDIESIEVLKDAAAAAVYGSQAANGVVLITTKRGKAGKTKLGINYYEGISAPPTNLKVLNSQDAIAMRTEALANANPTLHPNVARSQALSELGLSPDLTEDEIAALPTYDWQSEAFKRGSVRNIEFSASGGNQKTTYYVSGGYNKHDGNVTGIDFTKGAARFRLHNEATDRLSFDISANLSLITQNGNTGSQGSTSGSASPQYTAVYMPPTVPIYNPDGSFNAYPGMPGTGFNPIQAATVDDNIVRHRALVGNFSLNYKILRNLTFKSFYGIDYRFIRNDYYRDPRTPNGANVNGYLIDENIENVNFTTNQTLSYKTTIGDDHNLSAIAGAEYRSDVREFEMARGQGFPTHQYRTMQSAAEAVEASGSWSGLRKLGFFSQVNYEFMNRYFVSGTLRYDGSSRFGADNRMGLFPSISAGWDMAQEEFMSRSKIVNQLKLRVGYGLTGNDQISNVSSRGFYQGGSSYNGNAGITLLTMANTQLGWEKNLSTNIGLDYTLLNERVYGAIDVFHRSSKNLLLNMVLPYTSGFGSIDNNAGEVVNRGLEIELNTVNIKKKDFSWTTSFNITFLDNEVTELYDGLDFISNTIRVGHPLTIWYRPKYAGVNAANGRPMWYDVNGNITYLVTAADNVPTKKGWQSKYFGGLTNTFRYKGFELSALFHYDMGRYMANTQLLVLANVMNNPGRNSLEELYVKRWTAPGQITSVPRLIAGGAEFNSSSQQTTSTRFLEDASFIRLRDVTLAYRFSLNHLRKLKMDAARIYLTAVNLYTWTRWTGYDPEFAIGGTVESNQGIIPQTRSLTAGIQVSF